MNAFILLSMIFMHIFADFNMQGILSDLKQKAWWRKLPDYTNLYQDDYIIALIMHAISWTFLMMLPIALNTWLTINYPFAIIFIGNCALHAFIDHLKANKHCINLMVDQSLHLMQIALTWVLLIGA